MPYSKTPLRYPGGKSKALVKLSEQLPDLNAYDEYLSTKDENDISHEKVMSNLESDA